MVSAVEFNIDITMDNANTEQRRLFSLDALRGFDMFFIMGGDALFLCLGALFPGTVLEWWGGQMLHVGWHGFSFEDLIFPLFLFLAGVSFPFSLAKQRARGSDNVAVSLRVLRRAAILVLLGVLYNGLLQFDFDTLRYASVLGRIGLAWALAAIMYVWLSARWCAIFSVVVLVGYWLLLACISAPDADGASCYSMQGNIVSYIDRVLLPGALHNGIHDPEGILSTLPAVVTALLGIFTGVFIKNRPMKGCAKAVTLALAAIALVAVGVLWNNLIPINKNLWTSSFVCVAGGISLALFALFYYIIDVLEWRRWAFFFKVIGVNSITIYLAQHFFDFSFTVKSLFGGMLSFLPSDYDNVAFWLCYIVLCWLFLYFLYRRKLFLKV